MFAALVHLAACFSDELLKHFDLLQMKWHQVLSPGP